MPTLPIPLERFDSLANEATRHVFDSMVGEKVTFIKDSQLAGADAQGEDLFPKVSAFVEGYYTISVGFVGDGRGEILLSIPRPLAEKFALKLMDLPSIEWLGEDVREALTDVMGELGNMMVGLVKGGMTKWLPSLMLTTPKVITSARIRIENGNLSFRKQYVFEAMDSPVLVDFCFE